MPLISLPAVPTYLIPSSSFPRRKTKSQGHNASTDQLNSAARKTIESSSSPAPLTSSHISYIRCARCGSDICQTSQIISKGFTGRHGRAYLVSPTDPTSGIHQQTTVIPPATTLPNIITQRAVPRQLVTGTHVVADINCMICGSVLGWKYVEAQEEAQRYKVGKFIIETKRTTTSSCWEFQDDHPSPPLTADTAAGSGNTLDTNIDYDSALEFDSQDEDECEDLFAGVWSPSLARRRRNRKLNRKP